MDAFLPLPPMNPPLLPVLSRKHHCEIRICPGSTHRLLIIVSNATRFSGNTQTRM